MAAGLLLVFAIVDPVAANAQAPSASPLAAKCETLGAIDFAMVPDAPTHLNTAKLIAASAGKPAYCEVEGFVAPQVGLLMWLPAEKWNGKFLEVGCGGFCGMYAFMWMCEAPLQKGYACITTDMGHRAPEISGVEWAYNNPQAVIDFAYRATHVTALAGKAIAEAYYGRKPDKSYFHGCSCGGRQALVEAERFPWDFNGIIVGAPGMDYANIAITNARRARFLRDAGGKALFDEKSLAFVGRAIVAKCDLNDGVKDGQIGDPRLCKFNPRDIVCRAGATSDCLTREQAAALVSFYEEYRSASGDRVGEHGFLPGSELSFFGAIPNYPLGARGFYEDFFKYLALSPNPGPAWKFENFDLESDYKRLGMMRALMAADNPDLRTFKQAGGKLIFYHGWSDGGPSPLGSIDFYQTIERAMGGRASTQDFLRLFMVPDMDHCMGGKGPWTIDYLDYLEKWVEQDNAPAALIGAHFTDDPMAHHIPASAKPEFTRPIFPYPLAAKYKGSGNPNDAANFKAVTVER
jgi:hypothetical protein